MILDHKDIDIVVQPTSKKIVTFAKEMMSDVFTEQNQGFWNT